MARTAFGFKPITLERLYPSVIGFAVCISCLILGFGLPEFDTTKDLFATSMGFSAISVGFLATALSIVISAPDSPALKRVVLAGKHESLSVYLKEPFHVGLLVGSVCILGFVIPIETVRGETYSSIWAGLTVWQLLGLFRISTVFVAFIAANAHEQMEEAKRKARREAAQAILEDSPHGHAAGPAQPDPIRPI